MDTPTSSSVLARAAAFARNLIGDRFRAFALLLIFVLAFVPTLLLNPAKVGLALWGVSRIGLFGYLGYWGDRILYPYGRPHTLEGIARGAAEKRRALIVAAFVIAGALLP